MRFPNGAGSITRLSGNRRKPYGVRVTVKWEDGKQLRKYVGYYPTKMEAIQALAQYNMNPYDIDGNAMTLLELWEHWKDAEYDEGTKASQSAWRSGFKHCEPLHSMPIRDIKVAHIKELMKGKGGSTQAQIKGIMSKLFKHAIEYDWVDRNPAQLVSKKDTKPKKPKRVFSEEEINELWRRVEDDEFIETILILIYTGMRVTEMLEVKQENVHGDYLIGGKKTEAGIDRIIPIHHRIRPFIEKRLDGGEWLIQEDGGPLEYHPYRNRFMKRIKNHTIHETRHTFASRMHTAGVNDVTLKMIIGHSQPDITSQVYIHKQVDELLEAVERMP